MEFPSLYGIAELARGMKDVIYLNVGEPDFTTPSYIIEAAKKALDKGYTHYTPDEGIPELREAIAEYYNERYGSDYTLNNVLITVGATQAIFSAMMALIDVGDEVIVPDPWYPGYLRSIILAGGKVVSVRQDEEIGFQLDIDELNEKISKKTKALILINPNNPTGSVLTKKQLKSIVEIASDNKFFLIVDEIYERFVYEGGFYSIAKFPEIQERVIIINGFSKTYAMTGWRIGYAIAKKEILKEMLKVTLASTLCPSSVAQYAALAALRGPQEIINEIVREFDIRRRIIMEELKKIKGIRFVEPKGAFYIFPYIGGYNMKEIELVKYLVREAKVVTSPGYPFFGSYGRNHIRIAYTVNKEKLREAGKRMREALHKLIDEKTD